jgi:hypothetical protein
MPKNKTTETNSSVTDFINAVPDETKRKDSFKLIEIMEAVAGQQAKMWGPSIIGFGTYHYKYASGHEGDAPLIGFSPRKAAISLYMSCETNHHKELLQKFGKYKKAVGCIYIKKLEDVDIGILKEMAIKAIEYMKSKYEVK